MNISKKIQQDILIHLLKHGSIELLLPDHVTVEIGIDKEGTKGKKEITNDYCYVVATRKDRSTMIDSYNLSVQFEDRPNTVVLEDSLYTDDGEPLKRLDVL